MQLGFSTVGKMTRMNHIFRDDGRAAMVAINQGMAMGPRDGIENVGKIIRELIPESPDSFTIHRGMATQYADIFAGRVPLILKITNKTRFFGPDEVAVASVTDALALGADAISIGVSLCDEKEQSTVSMTSKIISEAQSIGMPTVAHAYPNGRLINDNERHSVENVGYAVRVAKELGIDIIKTFWTGDADSFAKIVSYGESSKIVISGGPKCKSLHECFDMTWQGIQAGCSGITYGRNIWQHKYPAAVLRGLIAIVHGKANVSEALEIASEVAGCQLS